jgi:hypothetical protein
MIIMKVKSIFLLGLTIVATALFADAKTTDLRIPDRTISKSSKGKSIMEHYRGSDAERKLDAQKRAYAPSARKNAEVFGRGKTEPRKRRLRIEDILEIIIEEKGGFGVRGKVVPKKKMEKGVLL